jgi:enamine deaminase RidA (YjgF/YER057c/UK114 family)
MSVTKRLASAGLTLGEAPGAAGAYRPAVRAGELLFISGQFPLTGEDLSRQTRFRGRIGAEIGIDEAREAAQLAALNTLSRLQVELGSFDALRQLVRVDGHLLTSPDFVLHASVLDAASELFALALQGKAGHARTVFGHASMPLNLCLELAVIAQVE